MFDPSANRTKTAPGSAVAAFTVRPAITLVSQDITNAIDGDFKDSFYPAAVQAFAAEGKSYGLPDSVGPIVFWYNKELCERADVDPSAIKYWEDLLDAVQKCKAAGVIPIVVGGSAKWPLQFYPALLMMRVLGKDGMASAYQGDNGGFAKPDVLKAWKLYKELCDLDSFQEGFQTTTVLFHPRERITKRQRRPEQSSTGSTVASPESAIAPSVITRNL